LISGGTPDTYDYCGVPGAVAVTIPIAAVVGDIYRAPCLVDDPLFVLGQKPAVEPAAVVAAMAVVGFDRVVQLVERKQNQTSCPEDQTVRPDDRTR